MLPSSIAAVAAETAPGIAQGTAEEARRVRILDGAMGVFLAYGFQRTTMDDIARAADISRPALYLLFRNKTDIYRALARRFLEAVLAQAREAMTREAPLAERLGGAVRLTCDTMLEIEVSPHGAEILDMRNSLAADIVAAGRAEFHAMIEAAIAADMAGRGADAPAPGFTAAQLADCLLDAVDGLKLRGPAPGEQRAAIAAYVAVITRAAV